MVVRDLRPDECAIQHVFGRPKGTVGRSCVPERLALVRKRCTKLPKADESIGIAEGNGAWLMMRLPGA